jgi:hypothetical protein
LFVKRLGRFTLATNGHGLLQGWNSLLVRPQPLPIVSMSSPIGNTHSSSYVYILIILGKEEKQIQKEQRAE